MRSIPVGTCGISRNNLKRYFMKNKRYFLDFFLHFLNCALNLEHLEKKDEYPSLATSKLIDWEKKWVHKRLKGLP